MIDNLIIKISDMISKLVNPSTLIKYALLSLIVSLPLSLILGIKVIILVLVVNNVLWLVTEYLYAKDEEDKDI